MECKLQQICKFCQAKAEVVWEPVVWPPVLRDLEPVQIVPKVVGGGSIKEKPAGRRWHCKKCAFTAPNAGVMASHCRLTHPKKAVGKKTAAVKKAPAAQESKSDKEAAKAFRTLQKRANKGKLTEEQTTVYDNLEPGIIGLPAEKWPDGSREAVIKLYEEVTGEE